MESPLWWWKYWGWWSWGWVWWYIFRFNEEEEEDLCTQEELQEAQVFIFNETKTVDVFHKKRRCWCQDFCFQARFQRCSHQITTGLVEKQEKVNEVNTNLVMTAMILVNFLSMMFWWKDVMMMKQLMMMKEMMYRLASARGLNQSVKSAHQIFSPASGDSAWGRWWHWGWWWRRRWWWCWGWWWLYRCL